MKKIFVLLIIVFGLASCGNSDDIISGEISGYVSEESAESSVEINIESSEVEEGEGSSMQEESAESGEEVSEQEEPVSEEVSENVSQLENSKETSSGSSSKNPPANQSKEESEEDKTILETSDKPSDNNSSGSTTPNKNNENKDTTYKPLNYNDVKAIWVSQFDMSSVYTNSKGTRDKAEYTAMVKKVIQNIKDSGFNTIILQIRPNGDSFYTSSYFPVSKYVTKAYGRELSYDLIGIFIEEAHKLNLSVQAWINPMRLMTVDEIKLISDSNPLKKLYLKGLLSEYSSRLYIDPSKQEAIDLIVNGAKEALEKYDFDGLHMDDYFYPTTDESFDAASFAASSYSDLSKFRVKNINNLVSSLYKMVKSVDSRLIFGISPAGNLASLKTKYYADVYEWCSKTGYIDYIMPQLYFGFYHKVCPFYETMNAWADIITNSNIKLYIGLTLGKAIDGEQGVEDVYGGTEAGRTEWIENQDVIKRSIEEITLNTKASGFTIFCYQYLFNPVTGAANDSISQEKEAFLPLIIG